MDALMQSRGWHWRATDWTAAAVAGLAGGAVLMVLDLVWSAFFNPHGPWRTSHMIAPIFIGTDVLKTSGYAFHAGVVAIALAVHYLLGILFGLVIAALIEQFRLDDRATHAAGMGIGVGVLLYLVNFEALAAFFPWLGQLQGAETVAAHVVFGAVAALLYWRLKRTPREA